MEEIKLKSRKTFKKKKKVKVRTEPEEGEEEEDSDDERVQRKLSERENAVSIYIMTRGNIFNMQVVTLKKVAAEFQQPGRDCKKFDPVKRSR